MPILIMYTCSAMTHIFEDVRTDAVKFLNLWIQIAPETVVSKFWNRITGNYMSLLSVDANNQQIGSVSMGKSITTASIKAAATKSHLHIHKVRRRKKRQRKGCFLTCIYKEQTWLFL